MRIAMSARDHIMWFTYGPYDMGLNVHRSVYLTSKWLGDKVPDTIMKGKVYVDRISWGFVLLVLGSYTFRCKNGFEMKTHILNIIHNFSW